MISFWKTSRVAVAISALLVLGFLSSAEWLAGQSTGTGMSPAGVVAGMSLAALLFALLIATSKPVGAVGTAAVASLRAITELSVLGIVVFALAYAVESLLPVSLTQTVLSGARAADVVVFVFLGVALAIAVRAGWRYADQLKKAGAAELAAARATAAVAERDRALAEAQMTILRAQIEPHFLWNTLSHVQYLAKKRPADAVELTGHLIGYLRRAQSRTQEASSTLGCEMEAVQEYLAIMRFRMGERLTVDVDIPQSLAGVPFAPLLLQTLAENAIKHGVEPKIGPVSVSARAYIDGSDSGRLVVEVKDNGVGLQAATTTKGTGIGLRNVRERLAILYGEQAVLSLITGEQGGVIARITVPYDQVSD
ncbi:sensor histidine kinase [Noviherbaspirillum autotrophicum]|uniref:sensor histidine kinase n=1 Tax=Noviherbaspirillum autotrophicum TaxID=709839 RepID=UPI000694E330|nr:histidine kinase [Noviherbaspirillum autotrophicum]